MNENIPQTRCTPKGPRPLSTEQMQAEVDVLMAERGAWTRLLAAKEALYALVSKHLYEKERAGDFSPVLDGLTDEGSKYLLLEHFGLKGEFGNAIQTAIQHSFNPNGGLQSLPLDQKILLCVQSFDDASQLSQANQNFRPVALQSGAITIDAQGKIIARESKIEGLWRVAKNIEIWAQKNAACLPEQDKVAIAEALAQYRTALPEVLQWVGHARSYVRVVEEKALKADLVKLTNIGTTRLGDVDGAMTRLLRARETLLEDAPIIGEASDLQDLRNATGFLAEYAVPPWLDGHSFDLCLQRITADANGLSAFLGNGELVEALKSDSNKSVALAEYRAALPEVQKFLTRAETYLAQTKQQGQGKQGIVSASTNAGPSR